MSNEKARIAVNSVAPPGAVELKVAVKEAG
jgi:hypothetical protein